MGMERSGNFSKTNRWKFLKKRLRRFPDRAFDWIAWVVITLVILSVLAYF